LKSFSFLDFATAAKNLMLQATLEEINLGIYLETCYFLS
jgi:hypothetical protein